jgi:hypothetical protein
MFRPQYQTTSSSVSKTLRCTNKYSLGQGQSSGWGSTPSTITETDLLKYEDLNMDLKELSAIFKDFNKKKTAKNSNLRKLNSSSYGWFGKKKTNNSSKKIRRNSIVSTFRDEETKFVKNIKKILSEKLRAKVLQRLDRLIKKPKEKRLNKVACALSALIEVLKSCGVSGGSASNEYLIKKYKDKISKEYPAGFDAATEFLNDILENKIINQKDISLPDFISKQSLHNKKLGEILKATIKELPSCSA